MKSLLNKSTLLLSTVLTFLLSSAVFAQDTSGTSARTNFNTETTNTQFTVSWILGGIFLVIVLVAFFRRRAKSRIISRKSSRKDRAHLDVQQ